jgi:GNAT superfamily N-acetyltransferase
LQIGSDNVLDLPTGHNTYLKNYTAFPAVHVGFLGVHEDYQGNGIGKYLLMDAFDKVCAISDCAGFYALTLQSLDADSTAFYEEIGFRAYSEGDGNPKMLYPINNLIKLVRDE